MTIQTKAITKGYFETGDIPTEAHFADLIDTTLRGYNGALIAASDSAQVWKDHADYVCDGTNDEVEIQAAHDDLPSTGGAITLAAGSFNIQTAGVTVSKPGVRIRGISKVATKITSYLNTAAFIVDIGSDGAVCEFDFSDFWMTLSGDGNGIQLNHNRSNYGRISKLRFTGGAAAAWCIDFQGTCAVDVSDINAIVTCNGIIWQSVPDGDADFGWGDSTVRQAHIYMTRDGTTGLKIMGTNLDAPKIQNNILLLQCETTGTGVGSTNIGVYIRNACRITLNHFDLENLGTGVLHESGQDGGSVNEANAFIQVFPLSCGDDYSVVGSPTHMTVIGGDGDFQTMQMLAGTAFP